MELKDANLTKIYNQNLCQWKQTIEEIGEMFKITTKKYIYINNVIIEQIDIKISVLD